MLAGNLRPVPVSAFGQNVVSLCGQRFKGLRDKEMAAELGVTPSMFSVWKQGKGQLPEGPTVIRIAKKLGASVDDLFRGVDADYDAARQVSSYVAERRAENSSGVTSPDTDSEVSSAPHVVVGGDTRDQPTANRQEKSVARALLAATELRETADRLIALEHSDIASKLTAISHDIIASAAAFTDPRSARPKSPRAPRPSGVRRAGSRGGRGGRKR